MRKFAKRSERVQPRANSITRLSNAHLKRVDGGNLGQTVTEGGGFWRYYLGGPMAIIWGVMMNVTVGGYDPNGQA